MSKYHGTCDDMCPASERTCEMRQLSIFECDKLNQPNEQAMVKEYRRAGADQKEPPPQDLRTPRGLKMTMDYLFANIVNDERSKNPELALEWYDFLWDRFRAVRKDITQQKMCDELATSLVERCARFHVHCCYAMSNVEDFDANMNKRSLNDCLQMLRQMYSDLRNEGIVCPNEFEFQKYDILLHLDRDPSSVNVLMKASDYRNSKEMKFIIRIYNSYSSNQFYTFFKLLEEADYMSSCILSLFVNKMRLAALKIIITSCTSKQMTLYPVNLAIAVLGLDDLQDLIKFAELFDICFEEREGRHYVIIRKDLVQAIRQVEPPVGLKSIRLVESKTSLEVPHIKEIDMEVDAEEEMEEMKEEPENESEDDSGEELGEESEEELEEELVDGLENDPEEEMEEELGEEPEEEPGETPEETPEELEEEQEEGLENDSKEELGKDLEEGLENDAEEDSPEEILEETPEEIPEDSPEEIPEETQEETPEETPQQSLHETPQETPKGELKDESEDKSHDMIFVAEMFDKFNNRPHKTSYLKTLESIRSKMIEETRANLNLHMIVNSFETH